MSRRKIIYKLVDAYTEDNGAREEIKRYIKALHEEIKAKEEALRVCRDKRQRYSYSDR